MARHNWGKIRGEYITGGLSQRQLAQKYGVSASQLAQKASKEGWRAARLEHRRKVEEKARQKAAERKAETMAAQLVDIGTAAESLAAMVAEVSQDTRMLRVGRGTYFRTLISRCATWRRDAIRMHTGGGAGTRRHCWPKMAAGRKTGKAKGSD